MAQVSNPDQRSDIGKATGPFVMAQVSNPDQRSVIGKATEPFYDGVVSIPITQQIRISKHQKNLRKVKILFSYF
jgi:hypothetical protein